jgi:hypothetical protein
LVEQPWQGWGLQGHREVVVVVVVVEAQEETVEGGEVWENAQEKVRHVGGARECAGGEACGRCKRMHGRR